jgi:hypothetical protein
MEGCRPGGDRRASSPGAKGIRSPSAQSEIADIMGISLRTVENHIARAVRRLEALSSLIGTHVGSRVKSAFLGKACASSAVSAVAGAVPPRVGIPPVSFVSSRSGSSPTTRDTMDEFIDRLLARKIVGCINPDEKTTLWESVHLDGMRAPFVHAILRSAQQQGERAAETGARIDAAEVDAAWQRLSARLRSADADAFGAAYRDAPAARQRPVASVRHIGPIRPERPRLRGARLLRVAAAVLALLAALAGCSIEVDSPRTEWRAKTDTMGDTIVVRTLQGSAWAAPRRLEADLVIGAVDGDATETLGSIAALAVGRDSSVWIFDDQAMELRHYGPDGSFLMRLGRPGAGPGEFRSPDGLAVLEDGRVVLRDPGNARFTVWQPDGGERFAIWNERGGYPVAVPLVVDASGRIATLRMLSRATGELDQRILLITPDGEVVDSLAVPVTDWVPPTVHAEAAIGSGTSSMRANVPFSPEFHWTFSPLGHVIAGLGDRLRIDVLRRDGTVLRIEREVPPTPVTASEREEARRRLETRLRRADPGWRWRGANIPEHKPAFTGVYAGMDARIWVLRPLAAARNTALMRSSDAARFDIFEPDGTYLGEVRAPEGFGTRPPPVFGRDHVWAVVRNVDGVNFLVRFRIAAPSPE